MSGSPERGGRSCHQGALSGLDAGPPGDRLFFAIHPDPQIARRIVALAEAVRAKHGLRGNVLPAERLHVTLHHLGDHCALPDPLIGKAGAAAERVAKPAFEISFDRVMSFPGGARRRPCVLRSETAHANPALRGLQEGLGRYLHEAGLERYVERQFTPHVTLLYADSEVVEAVPAVAWRVRSFSLVHSLLGRGQHRVLRSWPLT